jgi:hypothetical protein
MVAITIIMAINMVALLFVPFSPLVFLSTLLMAKKYKKMTMVICCQRKIVS